eukprot:286145_1
MAFNRLFYLLLCVMISIQFGRGDLGAECKAEQDRVDNMNNDYIISPTAVDNMALAASMVWALAGIVSVIASGGTAAVFFGVAAGAGGAISNILFFGTTNLYDTTDFDSCFVLSLSRRETQKMIMDQYHAKWQNVVVPAVASHSALCKTDTYSFDCYDHLQSLIDDLYIWRAHFVLTDSMPLEAILLEALYANVHLMYFHWYRASAIGRGTKPSTLELTQITTALKSYIEEAEKYFGKYLAELSQDISIWKTSETEIERRNNLYVSAWATVRVMDWIDAYKELCDLSYGCTIDESIKRKYLDYSRYQRPWQFAKNRGDRSLELWHYDPKGWGTFQSGSWKEYIPATRGGGMKSFRMLYDGQMKSDSAGTIGFWIKPKNSQYFTATYSSGQHPLEDYVTYGSTESCPADSYIAGYQLYLQGKIPLVGVSGSGTPDVVAVEGIRFICRNQKDWTFNSLIKDVSAASYVTNSLSEPDWYQWIQCPPGYFVQQISEKVDTNTGSGKTGLNNIAVKCGGSEMDYIQIPKKAQSCSNKLFACSVDIKCSAQKKCGQAFANGSNSGSTEYDTCFD